MTGYVQEILHWHQSDDRRQDQAEDDIAVPGAMQRAGELSRAHHCAAQSEEQECQHSEDDQGILEHRERPISPDERQGQAKGC